MILAGCIATTCVSIWNLMRYLAFNDEDVEKEVVMRVKGEYLKKFIFLLLGSIPGWAIFLLFTEAFSRALN